MAAPERFAKRQIPLAPRALPTLAAEWRLHDLRRTAATGMAELGVQPHVIEAVLNHVSGHRAGVAGVYNRATYAGVNSRVRRSCDRDHIGMSKR